jgi:hypothetical protein
VIGTFWFVPKPLEISRFRLFAKGVSGRRPQPFDGLVRAPSSFVVLFGALAPPTARCLEMPGFLAVSERSDASAFPGFWLLFATSAGDVHWVIEVSRLRSDGPSAAFRTLSTACSVPGLAGLFRPATAMRLLLQGFVPRSKAASRFRDRCPLSVQTFRLQSPAPSKRPRIQGFALPCECGGHRNR